ncbi:hypothetical protein T439DRAFT_58347 [Meredithblackwellia eburnea MCA 4105]
MSITEMNGSLVDHLEKRGMPAGSLADEILSHLPFDPKTTPTVLKNLKFVSKAFHALIRSSSVWSELLKIGWKRGHISDLDHLPPEARQIIDPMLSTVFNIPRDGISTNLDPSEAYVLRIKLDRMAVQCCLDWTTSTTPEDRTRATDTLIILGNLVFDFLSVLSVLEKHWLHRP